MINRTKNTASYSPSIPLESLAYQGFSNNPQHLDTEQNTCPSCGVIAPHNIVVNAPESPHYASLRCCECNRFIKWVGKPGKRQEREKRSQLIQGWLSNPQSPLTDWQRDFLTSISSAKHLSPKQQQHFDQIAGQLGGVR